MFLGRGVGTGFVTARKVSGIKWSVDAAKHAALVAISLSSTT